MLPKMDGNSMNNDLLLELFSEEIPARMQVKAANQMLEILENEIKNLQIAYTEAKCFVTPRRIAIYIAGLPSVLPEKVIEKKGPKVDAKPEALEGFLRSCGMKLDELVIVDGLYYVKKLEAARPINIDLKNIIEQMLLSFTWAKSMRMNNSRIRWVRPLRNILCLFGAQVLPVKFAELEANNYSFGHRFMSPDKFEVSSFADYTDKMRKAYVVLSSDERKEIIINQIASLTKNLGLKPILEEDLLNEVVGLVEYPNSLLGQIDKHFMSLPKEVLVSAMKNHQRYFYLEDESGDIAPYFLVVANVKHEGDALITVGNEKVLKARLSDAEFFWKADLKQPSSERLAKLAKLIFHHKLGTMFDKTNRIIALAEFVAGDKFDLAIIKKAALLCKNDLVSEMVGEFPELQGIMGKYYAIKSGQEPEVSLAIAEHYRPIDSNDIGDISKLGSVIAIADKIDSIVGLWLSGEKPTSSKDPFALRRAALGIIKLIRYHKFDLSLNALIENAVQSYELPCSAQQHQEILAFFSDRLKYYLKGEGFRFDLIRSVIDERADNIYKMVVVIENLQQFILKKRAQELVFALKRIGNILSQSEAKSLDVDVELLNDIEKNLYRTFMEVGEVKTCEDLIPLIAPINKFFDEILVNVDDQKLRQNRLNLLNNIANLSKNIADFNLIEV
jgi:glycyl-tRNA synthetase beta chain